MGSCAQVARQVVAVKVAQEILHPTRPGDGLVFLLGLVELVLRGLQRLLHLPYLLYELSDRADVDHSELRVGSRAKP